jgi:hypothetical protein
VAKRPLPLVATFGALLLVSVSVGLAAASDRSVAFLTTIDPPSTRSFDISWVENSSGKYFLADRSNKAVDLINASTDAFVGFIGLGQFVGSIPPASCAGGGNTCSGPDGVLTDSAGLLWVGDGNSTIKVLNPTAGTGAAALIKSIPTCPATSSACGSGGKFRADEESFDPGHNLILIANDAEGFLTFVHVDDTDPASSSVVGHFFYSDNTLGVPASVKGHATAGNGIEQSVFVPQTGLFYQAVPGCTDCTPAATGFIDVFDPVSMKLVDTFPVPGCDNGPTGLALGPNQRFLGACDNGAAAVQVRHGQLHTIVQGVGGADEIWFNPGDGNFYLGIGGPPAKLGVVDANNDHVVAVLPGKGGHSVAAYSANNHVFEPDRNGTGIDVFVSSGH